MSEQLLDLLKLGLLALLYLFFLRVIWAVWTELRAPALDPQVRPEKTTRPKRPKSASATPQLTAMVVLEPAELAGGHYPLGPEMTMGRAPGCTIVVDDTYVSQLHARVFNHEGRYHIEDLGSTNGTFHNGSAVSSPQLLKPGDRIQVGNMALELS